MATQTAPNHSAEMEAMDSDSQHTSMTSNLPVLFSNNGNLPSELLVMIAEACIESHYIYIEKIEAEAGCQHSLPIVRSSPTHNLACVSRVFKIGVKSGLRKRFDGHVRMPGLDISDLHSLLRGNDPAWMISQVTSITLAYDHFPTPNDVFDAAPLPAMKNPYITFTNLKHLDIACVFQAEYTGPTLPLIPQSASRLFGLDCYDIADRMRAIVNPPERAIPGLVINLVMNEVIPYRADVDERANFEVQFVTVDDVLVESYQTEGLDWSIRERTGFAGLYNGSGGDTTNDGENDEGDDEDNDILALQILRGEYSHPFDPEQFWRYTILPECHR